jgi:hypothetical protein
MRAFTLIEKGVEHGSALEELAGLSGVIFTQRGATEQQIERLVELVMSCQEDSTALSDLTTQLPEGPFEMVYMRSPEVASLLIEKFYQTCTSQAWPFDYTDVIGGACQRLFRATKDSNIRAKAAATAVVVGTSHNRFYVMDIAGRLMVASSDTPTALALSAILEKYRPLSFLERNEISKLHPALASLFETSSSGANV